MLEAHLDEDDTSLSFWLREQLQLRRTQASLVRLSIGLLRLPHRMVTTCKQTYGAGHHGYL
eukprot:SAG31_NODE_48_length_30945_cov_16.254263_20_plen_61_part_00